MALMIIIGAVRGAPEQVFTDIGTTRFTQSGRVLIVIER